MTERHGHAAAGVDRQTGRLTDIHIPTPKTKHLKKQVALLSTENVALRFEDEAIREVARVAALVNKTVENIGARRLHTVLERIVEVRACLPACVVFGVDSVGRAN